MGIGPRALAGAVCAGAALALYACGGSSGQVTGEDAGDAGAAEDGPAPDAGPPADAAEDAKPDVVLPEAGTTYCAKLSPAPRFCDDFDDGDVEDGWDVVTAVGGIADLEVEATSPPLSFAVSTFSRGAGESANVHLRTTKTGAPPRVRLAFSTYLSSATFDKGAIAIATVDVAPNHFFTLFLRDEDPNAPAAVLEESVPGTTTRHLLSGVPPANAWTRVTIDLDVAGGKATVSFDATKVLDGAVIQTTPAPSSPTIRIGAVYVVGPADPFAALFDDVVFDF